MDCAGIIHSMNYLAGVTVALVFVNNIFYSHFMYHKLTE